MSQYVYSVKEFTSDRYEKELKRRHAKMESVTRKNQRGWQAHWQSLLVYSLVLGGRCDMYYGHLATTANHYLISVYFSIYQIFTQI